MNNFPIIDVSRETHQNVSDCLKLYSSSFEKLVDRWLFWNQKVNVFSRKTTGDDLFNHIRHSLYLLDSVSSDGSIPVLDAGSGGGLPGVPLSIVKYSNSYILLDRIKKKQLVQRDIIRCLNLKNIETTCGDLADFHHPHKLRVVSMHAFPLDQLLSSITNLQWDELSILKGHDVLKEIVELNLEFYDINIYRINIDTPFFDKKYKVSISKKTRSNE